MEGTCMDIRIFEAARDLLGEVAQGGGIFADRNEARDATVETLRETGLVAGAVSYRPAPVDVPADGNVLICCSQPQGDVVIDL